MKPRKLPKRVTGRKRYCAFAVRSEAKPSKEEVRNLLLHSVRNFLGDLGLSESAFSLLDFDPETSTGIFSCSPAWIERLRLAVSLADRLGDREVAVSILGVSGTVKGVRRFLR